MNTDLLDSKFGTLTPLQAKGKVILTYTYMKNRFPVRQDLKKMAAAILNEPGRDIAPELEAQITADIPQYVLMKQHLASMCPEVQMSNACIFWLAALCDTVEVVPSVIATVSYLHAVNQKQAKLEWPELLFKHAFVYYTPNWTVIKDEHPQLAALARSLGGSGV